MQNMALAKDATTSKLEGGNWKSLCSGAGGGDDDRSFPS